VYATLQLNSYPILSGASAMVSSGSIKKAAYKFIRFEVLIKLIRSLTAIFDHP
jgi:hypothetical protein